MATVIKGNDWSDYFSNAFGDAYKLAAQSQFERWKYDKERELEEQDPLRNLLKRGQAAGAIKNLIDIGAISPGDIPMGSETLEQPPTISSSFSPTITPDLSLKNALDVNMWRQKPPYGFEINPLYEETLKTQLKTATETKQEIAKTGGFVQQFERSYNELKKTYPDIGKVGIGGGLSRIQAITGTKLGYFPETKAFLVELRPLANQMARTVEGGRVTDEDRRIYADSLANTIANPSLTNIRLVSNKLKEIRDVKGGDISKVMDELKTSKTDILQQIYLQTKYTRIGTNKKGQRVGELSDGTREIINGK